MGHGAIWPAHPKPLPDEILSSWIVRVADANGIKLQTLTRMLFGPDLTPWNRDVDRSAPDWLLRTLSQHTGATHDDLLCTTLESYRGRLFPHGRFSGQLRWILTVLNNGTKRQAYGQQYCPVCLATDAVPYFRKQWRVALFTYCPLHQVELLDACPACGAPVVHYRGDFGREQKDAWSVCVCHACGADHRDAERKAAWFPSDELHLLFDELLLSLRGPAKDEGRFDMGYFAVLHQMCRVIGARPNHGKLLNYLLARVGLPALPPPVGRAMVEGLRRNERHVWLVCALWLLADMKPRLREAWLAKAVRYNLLVKDFELAPRWYRESVKGLATRRVAVTTTHVHRPARMVESDRQTCNNRLSCRSHA